MAAQQACSLGETAGEVKALCTLQHQERTEASDQTEKKTQKAKVENRGNKGKEKGVRGNMFKLLETESEDEEIPEIHVSKETVNSRRIGDRTEWKTVSRRTKTSFLNRCSCEDEGKKRAEEEASQGIYGEKSVCPIQKRTHSDKTKVAEEISCSMCDQSG